MQFPLPLQLTAAQKARITQPFGATTNELEPLGPDGEAHFHCGVDIVCGDDSETYGTALYCPFPTASVEAYLVQAGNKDTPFVQLSYTAIDGTKYEAVLAHMSAMETPKSFIYGDLVGRAGNVGVASAQRSLKNPYAGAHLHLGLKVNGEWVDPERYFDFSKSFSGDAAIPQNQLPTTNWLVQELVQLVKVLNAP
jgi:hypothetical protein